MKIRVKSQKKNEKIRDHYCNFFLKIANCEFYKLVIENHFGKMEPIIFFLFFKPQLHWKMGSYFFLFFKPFKVLVTLFLFFL